MRKKLKTFISAVFVIALIFSLTACGEPVADDHEFNFAPANNTGKTLNQMLTEYPELEYADIGWGGFTLFCLKAPDDDFYYTFFGTQFAPFLEELRDDYGDRLKVAGVVATVGEIFPVFPDNNHENNEMPIDEFFEVIGVSEYDYDFYNGGAWFERGFIWFDYGEFGGSIDISQSAEFENYERLNNMNSGFPIYFYKREYIGENSDVVSEAGKAMGYWD